MADRKTLAQMAAEAAENSGGSIAGQPADKCPHCGAVVFVDRTIRTDHEIVRYIQCRNTNCGKRFMTRQPPARLVREL